VLVPCALLLVLCIINISLSFRYSIFAPLFFVLFCFFVFFFSHETFDTLCITRNSFKGNQQTNLPKKPTIRGIG
jgi:hypothetical protein